MLNATRKIPRKTMAAVVAGVGGGRNGQESENGADLEKAGFHGIRLSKKQAMEVAFSG